MPAGLPHFRNYSASFSRRRSEAMGAGVAFSKTRRKTRLGAIGRFQALSEASVATLNSISAN
jgi:hypothetical protein